MIRTAIRVATVAGALLTAVACQPESDVSLKVRPAAAADRGVERGDHNGNGHGARHRVRFDAPGAPEFIVLTPNCSPVDAAVCILPINYKPGPVTGDITGTAFGTTATIGRNGVFPGASLVVFTGTVRPCGTGSLLLPNQGTFDPATGLTIGTWNVYEGSGTGQLSSVTGRGTMVFDAAGGHFKGWVRCGEV